MAVNAGADIVTNGLIFYLDGSNERCFSGSGTSLKNLFQNINYSPGATLENGTTVLSRPRGYFQFDGTNDYIACGNAGGLFDITVGTISIWYGIRSFSNGGSWTIGTNTYEQLIANTSAWGIFIYLGAPPASTQIVSYDWGNGANRAWTSNALLTNGTWTNLVLTFEETGKGTPSNNAKAYVNGVLDSTFTIKHSAHTNLRLGANADGAQFFGSGFLNYPMVYNRVLEQSEILQNYYALKGRLEQFTV
jgi:hypothetical protein